jgi:hypothetical protein
VAEALGRTVTWDGLNRSVYIGEAPAPAAPAVPETKASPAEDALKKWVSENKADLVSVLEEYFGEGAKVLASAEGSKLTLDISKTSKAGTQEEERARQEEDFIRSLTGMESDYQQMLDWIRADTGYKQITMDVWHYFDKTLIFTQQLR